MKAVIYARFSSEKQTEQSIEGQVRVCREYAERNGYEILRIYDDHAVTGRNDNRPKFQQMLSDSEKHEFEAVLVYKLDRFSRNVVDLSNFKDSKRLVEIQERVCLERLAERFFQWLEKQNDKKP